MRADAKDDRIGRPHDTPEVGRDAAPALEVLPGSPVVRHRDEGDAWAVGSYPSGSGGSDPEHAGEDAHVIEDIQAALPERVGEQARGPDLAIRRAFVKLVECNNDVHCFGLP